MQNRNSQNSTILGILLIVGAATSITILAIFNRCPLSMEGGASGFKLQIEQCSNEQL